MHKSLSIPLLGVLLLTGCIAEEPHNAECDIEVAALHVTDAEALFYHDYDTLQTVSSVTDSIGFLVRRKAVVGSIPVSLKVTSGATVLLYDGTQWQPFSNGTSVDFSGAQVRLFRVTSQDRAWHRTYKMALVPDASSSSSELTISLDFNGNYALNDPSKTVNDAGVYYVWAETDPTNVAEFFGDESWKCGNPGFRLSRSSAKPMEYPTVPVAGGGPDGSDCVKLETMDTGPFGRMVNMRIASGSLFTGYFDVGNALKNARKATQFGLPFKHKPTRMTAWLKFEPGTTYQDKDGKAVDGVVDEPDAYLVIYRNQDAQGGQVLLDGDNVLTSEHIVGMARLPHNYIYEHVGDRTVRRDQLSNTPVHGLTGEWKEVVLDVEYTTPLDAETLANNGYSMVIGFASSWQGAYFTGAIGTKLWIDKVKIVCEE